MLQEKTQKTQALYNFYANNESNTLFVPLQNRPNKFATKH